jgi:FkbH-like protein
MNIIKFESKEYDKIIEFLCKSKYNLRNNHPFKSNDIFNWFFKYDNSLISEKENIINGVFFANKFNYMFDEKLFSCNECSMLCSSSNGIYLINKMTEVNSCISFGINRETFYPICKNLGYTVGEMNRYTLATSELINKFLKYFNYKSINYKTDNINIDNDLLFSDIKIEDVVECYINFIKENNFLALQKNVEYFEWRYFKCPHFNYKIYGNKDNGFIIGRIETINIKNLKNYRVFRIIEIFYNNKNLFSNLLNQFINYCKYKNFLLIDFYFSNNYFDELLNQFNFVKNTDNCPYLFSEHNPEKIKNLNYAYLAKNNENANKLYLVKSNVDQDLPREFNKLSIKITKEEQLKFCNLSGDFNSLHFNEKQNSNCYFTKWNCHGANVVLKIFDTLFNFLNLYDIKIDNLNVNYIKEVNIDELYFINFKQSYKKIYIDLLDTSENIKLKIDFEYSYELLKDNILKNEMYHYTEPKYLKRNDLEKMNNDNENLTHNQKIDKKLFNELYPNINKFINMYQISTILSISNIVGMKIPGKHSLCLYFNLKFYNLDKPKNNNLNVKILSFNLDSSYLNLEISSDYVIGEISCLYFDKICSDKLKNKINKDKITIGILSNVNIDPIKNILQSKFKKNKDNVNIITIEYGQMLQNLNFSDSIINKNNCEYIFIIDRPEDILRKSIDEISNNDNEIIEYYFNSIEKFINNNKNTQVYIMNYFLSNKSINFNCFDNKVIYDFNKKIYHLADNYPNCYILKNVTAENITDKRMWYIGKIPYTDIFFENLSQKIFGIILSHLGLTTRLLILDLDNTLWGGVVGEDGVHGIKLGEDYPGNVFVDFQKKIKLLKERGIALAICSKNDLSIVNEVFEKNKNMILKKEDFVYIEANWKPKVDNIKKISEKIGLGLKNILFVDDNPVERDQVKQFLPDVKVLDLPDDPIEYIDCLLSSPYLEVHKITESDKNRTNTYQKKVIVDKLKEDYGSNKEDFYKHLELEIFINNLTNENKDRCIQLLSKTNQFNTTTLRLTENDILTNNYKVYVLGAKDKYNDYENMGVMVTKELDDTLEIIDYLLSCRFLGKNLENEFIKWILNYSENKKFKKIIGKIIETNRNKPVRNIFKNNNFIINENNIWEFNINEKVKYTDYIKITENLTSIITKNEINKKKFGKKDNLLNNNEYFNISIKLKNILKDLIDDESKYIFENLIDTNKLFNDINLIPSWTSLKHIIFINKFEKCLGKKLTSNEISNFKLISDFDNLIKNLKD